MDKKCFKCEKVKPMTDFYKHPKMADGHVNKCKDCNKLDVQLNYRDNSLNPDFIEKERTRNRRKYRRLYLGTGTTDIKRNIKYENKYPEKAETRKLNCTRLVPAGMEAHHWSYNIADRLDVIALSKKDHMKGHRFLIYDQERMMYRRCDTNELLDTKGAHEAFLKWCIQNMED